MLRPIRAGHRDEIARCGQGSSMRTAGWSILALSASLCVACADVSAPADDYEEVGVLQLVAYTGPRTVGADESVEWSVAPGFDVLAPPRLIAAPDTVDVDVAFDVTVTTVGLSGCWSAAGQRVHYTERVIEFTPLDVHSGARACTAIVQFLERTSTVRLDTEGEWTLRVKGRRLPYLSDEWEQQVSAERTIVAR